MLYGIDIFETKPITLWKVSHFGKRTWIYSPGETSSKRIASSIGNTVQFIYTFVPACSSTWWTFHSTRSFVCSAFTDVEHPSLRLPLLSDCCLHLWGHSSSPAPRTKLCSHITLHPSSAPSLSSQGLSLHSYHSWWLGPILTLFLDFARVILVWCSWTKLSSLWDSPYSA